MMTIRRAEFLLSQSKFGAFPKQGMPEIAMAGKSNVGKSSLINSLCRRSKLARTSSEPGKTRLINYYLINDGPQEDGFLLVDLPGYGFARAPKGEQRKWADMIEGYLTGSRRLMHVFHLVDIRHEPTQEDQMMVAYLRHYDIPFSVIATKADKLSKAQRSRSIPVICRTLAVQPWEVLTYSSEDLTGRDALLEKIEAILSTTTITDDEI